MKQYIKSFVYACLALFMFGACSDDKTPVYDFSSAPELAPLSQPALVLNEQAANFIAETFSWSKGEFGFTAAPTYVLQIDNDAQFPDPVILAEANNRYVSVTVAKMNTAATILGAVAGQAKILYLRLQANLTPDVYVYSKPIDVAVTTYPQVIDYPKLYAPGSYQSWDITNAPSLISSRMNNKYEGYIDMNIASDPNSTVTFKFTTQPSWSLGVQYGTGGAPGTLKTGGGDISISPQAYYLFNVNLNTLTYTATPVSKFAILGSAVSSVSQEAELAYNPTSKKWEGSVNLITGTLKVKVNGNASLVYGDADGDTFIDRFANGEIPIEISGTYSVKIGFTKKGVYITISPLS